MLSAYGKVIMCCRHGWCWQHDERDSSIFTDIRRGGVAQKAAGSVGAPMACVFCALFVLLCCCA